MTIERESAFTSLLLRWGASAFRDLPWRKSGLTPYEVLLAEVLLKRTTATAVAREYPAILATFPRLEELEAASQDVVSEALKPIGLYHQRARGLKAMASTLTEQYGGEVPASLEALAALPHVGPYTARAVLSFGFDQPHAVVDSNVVRVLGRAFRKGVGPSPTVAQVQEVATSLLPKSQHKEFNWALLDLGAKVCRYVRPSCPDCPLLGICDSGDLWRDGREPT